MKTLATAGDYEEIIKGSRFIVKATPVSSEEEANAFFEEHRDPEATHNCWAWKIGNNYRFSDDGEPGGTAGRPMFTAIERQELDRVAVLVIRHFGGTKLGAGGLVRAYGGTTGQCLRDIEKEEILTYVTVVIDGTQVRFFLGYSGWGEGQLREEIGEDSWLVADIHPDTVMQSSPKLWNKMVKKQGGIYSIWENYPENPSMN